MFITVLRTTKFALQNSWRNLWLSIVTIFLFILTTFSITLVIGLNVLGQQLINAVQEKVDIDLYFYTNIQEQDVLDVQKFLQEMEEVKSVVYVSSQEAEQWYREQHANESWMIESIDELDGEDIFPARLIVRTHDLEDYPKVITRFEQSEYTDLVDEADYNSNQEIIARMSDIKNQAYRIGIAVSLVFIIISVIVIFNTIRVTIYSYREEVGIMKLVGATNWFIRGPFLIEGVLLGVISAGITIAFSGLVVYLSDAQISDFFTGYNFSIITYMKNYIFEFVLIEVIAAVLLSVVSSMVAITRYLKV